jgi:hypothetical protein
VRKSEDISEWDKQCPGNTLEYTQNLFGGPEKRRIRFGDQAIDEMLILK